MRPVKADTDPAHDDRLRTANYTGFQHPAMVFFCPPSGVRLSHFPSLDYKPRPPCRWRANRRSDSRIRIASRQTLLQKPESKGRWQIQVSSGASDLTFAYDEPAVNVMAN